MFVQRNSLVTEGDDRPVTIEFCIGKKNVSGCGLQCSVEGSRWLVYGSGLARYAQVPLYGDECVGPSPSGTLESPCCLGCFCDGVGLPSAVAASSFQVVVWERHVGLS